jgi:hypothetical protein
MQALQNGRRGPRHKAPISSKLPELDPKSTADLSYSDTRGSDDHLAGQSWIISSGALRRDLDSSGRRTR